MAFVKQDSTTGVMSNVEVIREAHVLKILNRLSKSSQVPFLRNVFFNGSFCASSRPSIPAQDAEACLLKPTVGQAVVGTVTQAWVKNVFGHGHRGNLAVTT